MDNTHTEQINKMIEYIIARKFPNSSGYERKAISGRKDLIQAIQMLRDELKTKSYEEIEQLCREEAQKEIELNRQKAEQIEQQRFFNTPSAQAHLEEAIKLLYWTPDEAVAYSLNKNPIIVNWQSIKRYVDESLFVKEYKKRKELIERALEIKDLNYHNSYAFPAKKFKPDKFIAWAIDIFNSLPQELIQISNRIDYEALSKEQQHQLKEQNIQIKSLEEKLKQYEKPLHPRKEVSYQKLLYVYLIQAHQIIVGPPGTRTDSIGKILRKMEEAQLDMNDETIRDIIREAKAYCEEFLKEQKSIEWLTN